VVAPRRAEGAKFLMSQGVKARRACEIMGISTATPYRKPGSDRDEALREKLRQTWRPNMGYRMAHALVKEAFAPLNVKRIHLPHSGGVFEPVGNGGSFHQAGESLAKWLYREF
jgi:hypothetical protein